MTVVAWDGRMLAADKRGSWNGLSRRVTKIYRINGVLVGISGNASEGYDMIEWLGGGRDPARFPANQRDEKLWAAVIVIETDRRIHFYERSPSPVLIEDTHTAIGSGRDFALAAMHLGCDARRAVEVACAYQHDCGEGVDILEFVV